MGLLQDLLLHKLTTLSKEQLNGVTRISAFAFSYQPLLKSIEVSDSVEYIGSAAFIGNTSLEKIVLGKNVSYIEKGVFDECTAVTEIDAENIKPETIILSGLIFKDTVWHNNLPAESMITIANGSILYRNTIAKPSNGFEIPTTVTNLAPQSLRLYGDTADTNFTSAVIPDTVEIVQTSVFGGQSGLTQITIGSGVKKMTGTLTPHDKIKNLIFRQPAGMIVELPTAGTDGSGLGYYKDAYSMNIYTDNECIRNYDWAKDNVTATFYPLSEAPA